jgi:N-methylhydantoinase B
VLEDNGAAAFFFGDRARFAPTGVAGGENAALNVFSYQQADGWHHPPLASKMVGIKLAQGQRVRLETPGGGGYGPPSERPAPEVARDVADGYLTPDNADAAYGPAWREGSR